MHAGAEGGSKAGQADWKSHLRVYTRRDAPICNGMFTVLLRWVKWVFSEHLCIKWMDVICEGDDVLSRIVFS